MYVCARVSTHNVRAVGVVACAGDAAIAGEHLGHVLRLIFREAQETHARASKHFQFVLFLQKSYIKHFKRFLSYIYYYSNPVQ